jgi:superfamily II DNA or RNA helicase/diadenosine tetraphosphate (Ap4A) HIT family hydrolase/HKD family nuclease
MPANPFKNPDPQRIFLQTDLVIALWDAFPVSPGHALLIPRREVPTWFDATPEEQQALTQAITLAKQEIEKHHNPDGYNIGINAGAAAGQTVFHLHVHVIPRYTGDVEDPRGGVRHVIPAKANYLVKEAPAPTYGAKDTLITSQLLDHLSKDLEQAHSVDLAVAFMQPSGLAPLMPHFEDLLFQRHGRARILTGDYLDITHPDALEQLLNLSRQSSGRLQIRIYQASLANKSFHPKAYLFTNNAGQRTAYVGSSNISAPALTDAVEWNYRVVDGRDPTRLVGVQLRFEELFSGPHTTPLTYEWLAEYRRRRKPLPTRGAEPVEVLDDPAPQPATPHPIQEQALEALRHTREQGNKAGLVVLATGLGKTWLSAFDSEPYTKILFLAHREEILSQSMATYRRIRPQATFGFYHGQEKSPHADILFASIQTLTNHLQAFHPKQFDYIVVDEFHHASAPTYRKVIDYFEPQFLLGLTATPERTDGGNLLALCGQNLVFRCDLAEGMQAGRLCPMHYYGVPDIVDYSNIPWRSTRFDPEELTTALATTERAQNAIEQHQQRAGLRTVAFCCTTAHADFMTEQFNQNGVRAVAVHSGPRSANRTQSLEQLKNGQLQVICCVDMFNEGVDLPQIDTVMMLRPTESRIIWLQQLGRGLRKAEGKSHLNVIDYIGNHRTFRLKLETLVLALLKGKGRSDDDLRRVLRDLKYDQLDLPPGCKVTYDLEAVEILKTLLRPSGNHAALIGFYEDFEELEGERPTALEAYQADINPRAARGGYDSWFGFVDSMKGLSEAEAQVWRDNRAWFEHLGKTAMSKSYKMVVLQAMQSAEQFPGQMTGEQLARAFRKVAERSARLRKDVEAHLDSDQRLLKMLEKSPIDAWCGGKGTGGTAYFEYDGAVFRTSGFIGDGEVIGRLTREIVEWRLTEHLDKQSLHPGFKVKVNHSGSKPILFPLNRKKQDGVPRGEIEVVVAGETYLFRFVKEAVNVATRPGETKNVLPEVLREMFGEMAGASGTRHFVRFKASGNNWTMTRQSETDDTVTESVTPT